MTDGAYGWHAPGAGVDIEPDNPLPAAAALRPGRVTFLECEFRGSKGCEFVSGYPTSEDITIRHCRIVRESQDEATIGNIAVALAVVNGRLLDCDIDAGPGYVYAAAWDGCSTELQRCTIRSSNRGIRMDRPKHARLLVAGCQIVGTFAKASPLVQPDLTDEVEGSTCTFVNNTVFRPTAAYAGTGAESPGAQLKTRESKGNVFKTDLTPQTHEHVYTQYDPMTVVSGDRYGSGSACRPEANSSWDTSAPFSKNTTPG